MLPNQKVKKAHGQAGSWKAQKLPQERSKLVILPGSFPATTPNQGLSSALYPNSRVSTHQTGQAKNTLDVASLARIAWASSLESSSSKQQAASSKQQVARNKQQVKSDTSLAAKGALAHSLQRRTARKIQNGRQGAPKWPTGSGKGCTPRFLGILSNFR